MFDQTHLRSSLPAPDRALVKALARAHQWKAMLLRGKFDSVSALAWHLKIERRHVGRILNLAFLSPDLTKQILGGHQAGSLHLAKLLKTDIPLSWTAQAALIETISKQNP